MADMHTRPLLLDPTEADVDVIDYTYTKVINKYKKHPMQGHIEVTYARTYRGNVYNKD